MDATLQLRVTRKAPLAEDIAVLELARADGEPLPATEAGAHVELHLPGGLVRPYSLCHDPARPQRWRLAVLREPAGRGGSAAVHDALHEGDLVTASAPRNLFPLVPARRSLLLAGGIGLTPLLAMAWQLHGQGADFALHACARSAARAAFTAEIAAAPWAPRAHWHLDDGPAAQRLDLATVLGRAEAGTHVYVCGPAGFIEAVLQAARAAGYPEDQLHREYFGAAPQPAGAVDAAFEVQVGRGGPVLQVAAGQTVVQALAAGGIELMTSCEQGVCGTCLTGVLEGTPDHRDQYLTDEERAAGDRFLPCCSRACSARLVLDL